MVVVVVAVAGGVFDGGVLDGVFDGGAAVANIPCEAAPKNAIPETAMRVNRRGIIESVLPRMVPVDVASVALRPAVSHWLRADRATA